MIGHKLIPNIDEKITNKLKELKLTPSITPKKFIEETNGNKHRYSSLCKNQNGDFLIFYARLHNNEDAKRKVRKELLFSKNLENDSFRNNLPFKDLLPRYYKGEIEKDFEWFEREYIKENPLGVNEKLNEKLNERIIKNLSLSVFEISKTDILLFNNIPLKKFIPRNYNLADREIEKAVDGLDKENNLARRIKEFLIENQSLLERENRYLSHGDFNLGNIIETKEKKLKLIDWESMGINNFSYDIGYLFMHLWEATKNQRKYLIETFLSFLPKEKQDIFKKLFQATIIYLAIGGKDIDPIEIKESKLERRRNFFENILKNSLEFKKLIGS